MSIIEAIVLGLVQGLTEFIPISSTAHLRIVPALLGWEDPGAATSAVIQLGTLLAVLIYFWRDIIRLARGFVIGVINRGPMVDPDSRMAWFIIAGSVPVVVLGLAFKDFIEKGARALWIISASLVVVAILLLIAERYARAHESRDLSLLTLRDALAIGLGQSLALIPGMSRSGTTIMVGLFRNLTHAAAARFSFLLSIPAIAGSGVFELIAEREHLQSVGFGPIVVATIVSFVSGWASIWFLLRYLKTHTTHVFIYYRIVLGVVMAILVAKGIVS